ncbi:hypothetical protein [Natrinema sp. 1APR25-10V2]|uniref:hypothetical protein n=1 Tax=Natrinema sp. 1APR25-10V2 TaxID=2951081 RepID=UPI002876ADC2|nr:hypothetical protein [Natrinema sp. 1APR25-10V2]MDS0477915.1 hypothetical protein [Natrinema sp. 1APR25-10V2]
MTDDDGDGRDRNDLEPDRPRVEPADVSSITEDDRDLNAALVETISDGAGTDAFDRADWSRYAKAVLAHRGHDPENVVIVANDDGVEIVPMEEYRREKESLAAISELATRYLRRVERRPIAEIEQMTDIERVQAFVDKTGAGK